MSTISRSLGPDAQERLAAYVGLVRLWAPRLDLVAPADLGRFEDRHVADSLKGLAAVGAAPRGWGVDVGSGAGLPGIPLAIASDRPWRLLEPRKRRAGFLEEAVRRLELKAEVVALSAEEAAASPNYRGHAVATARALAPPLQALELSRPLVAPSGVVLLWVGDRADLPEMAEIPSPGLASIRVTGDERDQ